MLRQALKGRRVKVFGMPRRLQAYTRSWSISMPPDLYADSFEAKHDDYVGPLPKLCDEHTWKGRPICFKVRVVWTDLLGPIGFWRLVSPINIPKVMPGDNPRLVGLSIQSMRLMYQATGGLLKNNIAIVLDGGEVWSSKILFGKGVWRTNTWDPNVGFDIPLTGRTSLNLTILQGVTTLTGAKELHNSFLTITGQYETDIPPAYVTVEITVADQMTGALLDNAFVRILSGATVVAQGYTKEGVISFPNIEEGGYTITIKRDGYEILETTIQATPPSVVYTFYLAPIPTQPIPWYVWAGIGVGGLVVLTTMIRRPMVVVAR